MKDSDIEILEKRDLITQSLRSFFHKHRFTEVQTPVRVRTPALEEHIDAQESGKLFLRTSPELHMKRLLCAGHKRIFQIGPCFRKDECGQHHSPEFTMLEWYRANADYRDILDDTQKLILAAAGNETISYQGHQINLRPPWAEYTVSNAFMRFAGWDPVLNYDAARFDVDLVEKVEPHLPSDRPAVLTDYPVELAALARCRADAVPVAERWELYIGGLELANAYSELTDVCEQRRRFDNCLEQRRAHGSEIYPVDTDFLSALKNGMPPSGGVALGIDRLIMLLTDSASINDIISFKH
jgi:lysyl-tRNA synthetase class 2